MTTRVKMTRGYNFQVVGYGPVIVELTGFTGIVRGRWTGLSAHIITPEFYFDGMNGEWKVRRWEK